MLERLRTKRRNREIVDALYEGLVEAARHPALFTRCALPDTVMGRFESLSIQVFLFLARCRDDGQAGALAQDLVDRFMIDVEDSIRQIGVGDVAVPKRMRKLAGMFYERVAAYDPPLRAADEAGLAAALARHAFAPDAPGEGPRRLAAEMIARRDALGRLPADAILSGRLGEAEGARP